MRKHLLEYDDVMNRQREIIYRQRRGILGEHAEDVFLDLLDDAVEKLMNHYCSEKYIDQWDLEGLQSELYSRFKIKSTSEIEHHSATRETLQKWVSEIAEKRYHEKVKEFGSFKDVVLRQLLLEITDNMWKDHLLSMDHLKEGIGMRGYAQKNPLNEYKKEGYEMFADLMERISEETVKAVFSISIVSEPPTEIQRKQQEMELIHGEIDKPQKDINTPKQAPVRKARIPGRNDPCYCGSGKKYKNCHLKEDQEKAAG